jgi:hypothetical protein
VRVILNGISTHPWDFKGNFFLELSVKINIYGKVGKDNKVGKVWVKGYSSSEYEDGNYETDLSITDGKIKCDDGDFKALFAAVLAYDPIISFNEFYYVDEILN